MIGRVAGNYKIVEKLGEGGMGAVYKGIDIMVEREVAIKMLRPEIARQPEILERFRSEAVTLAKLNHSNIATLYSFFRNGDEYFMVMEFVPGRTLDTLLQQWGPMPVEGAVRVFSQVLDGIHHAHTLGILHRDIKPANIMLTDAGAVKVTDFGIARVLGQARMTRQGNIVGTLEYIAPERVRGEEADLRSDIYSLGAVLYEMLSGHLPFEHDNEFALMQAHLSTPVPTLASRGIAVPGPVEKVLNCALAKKPADRYQTAVDFRTALDAAWSEASAQPQPRATRLAAPAPKETRMAVSGTAWKQMPGVAATRLALPAQTGGPSLVQKLGWKLYAAVAALLVIAAGVAAFLGGVLPTRRTTPQQVTAPGPGLELPKNGVTTPAQQVLQNSVPVPDPESAAEGEPKDSPAKRERQDSPAPQVRRAPTDEERRRAALKALEGAASADQRAQEAAREKERRRLEALKALQK